MGTLIGYTQKTKQLQKHKIKQPKFETDILSAAHGNLIGYKCVHACGHKLIQEIYTYN